MSEARRPRRARWPRGGKRTGRAWQRLLACLLIAAATLAMGCRQHRQGNPGLAAARDAGPTTGRNPTGSPRSRSELPTTSADIALGNLVALIEQLERHAVPPVTPADPQPTPSTLASLGRLYLTRGRLLSRIDDLSRADAVTRRALAAWPNLPEVLLARASACSTFHRFDEAWRLLDEAARRGARPSELEAERASILEARGRFAEARPLRERQAQALPSLQTLMPLAALDGDEGRLDDAERHFAQALDHYRDVSPLPVAKLWLVQGTLWQRQGRPARARELLEAALERLPQLAPAAGHLAALLLEAGEVVRAEALLRPLVASSDDPEYLGQLAAVLRRKAGGTGAGADAEAEAAGLYERARDRFEALLASHPEAFADHAARFYLSATPAEGGDPKRALSLATAREQAVASADAALLVVEAATAAGEAERACEAAERLVARAGRGPSVRPLLHAAWKALTACGRTARAEEVLRLVETPDAGR